MPHFGLENDSSMHFSSDGIGAWVGSGQYCRECRTGDEATTCKPRRPRKRNLAMTDMIRQRRQGARICKVRSWYCVCATRFQKEPAFSSCTIAYRGLASGYNAAASGRRGLLG